jgi:demethylmenaquinone methyltransferase / 2-methoxy-6-polyprenyl-1,4-benzoquinol methylase
MHALRRSLPPLGFPCMTALRITWSRLEGASGSVRVVSAGRSTLDVRRPHVVGRYYDCPEGKQRFLRDIFDRTAPFYEAIARWGWFGTGDAYRRSALRRAGFRPDMRAIDVASGTGPTARALLRVVHHPDQVVCAEPSAGMIAEARKSVPCVHHQTTAEDLPVADASFDFLTMGFALRHVDDLDATFREFRRVLRPGGKALIMDVTTPESAVGRILFTAYFKHVLPALALVFSRDRAAYRLMKYYWETMEQMTRREEVADIMRAAGFRSVEHRVYLGCFSEYEAVR